MISRSFLAAERILSFNDIPALVKTFTEIGKRNIYKYKQYPIISLANIQGSTVSFNMSICLLITALLTSIALDTHQGHQLHLCKYYKWCQKREKREREREAGHTIEKGHSVHRN